MLTETNWDDFNIKAGPLQADYEGLFWEAPVFQYRFKIMNDDGRLKWTGWLNITPRQAVKRYGAIFDQHTRKLKA